VATVVVAAVSAGFVHSGSDHEKRSYWVDVSIGVAI
jgi:hypothetical protein